MDPQLIMAALGQIGNMAGRVQDIFNPVADPTQGDYKFNWANALNPLKGGITAELAKKMSMDNARSKYVMGASPGNYAKGGMISKAKARKILHDGTVHGKPITEKQRRFFGAMATRKAAGGMIADMMNPTAALDMLNQPQAVKALLSGRTNTPMKMGGMMNYAMGGRLVDEDMNPNDEAGEYDNYRRRFATGGDMRLSDSSFLVNGNPSVTDGNFYPQLNAKLDHGEVVKDNFVFSNKLKDPQTNVTYAKLAQPVEKSTGKAEKFMKRFQNDAFSKNTVMQNNKFLDSLSNKQEMLATAMGLRQNEQPMGYAAGGDLNDPEPNTWYKFRNQSGGKWGNPIDATTGRPRHGWDTADDFTGYAPGANQTFVSLGTDNAYFDPYKQQVVIRNSKGYYVPVEQTRFKINNGNVLDTSTNKAYNTPIMPSPGTPTMGQGSVAATATGVPSGSNFPTGTETTSATNVPGAVPASSSGQNIPGTNMPAPTTKSGGASGKTTKTGSGKRVKMTPAGPEFIDTEALRGIGPVINWGPLDPAGERPMLTPQEQADAQAAFKEAGDLTMGPLTQQDYGITSSDQRAGIISQMYAKEDPTFFTRERGGIGPLSTPNAQEAAKPTKAGLGQKWTAGDYMNAAAVLGRFGQLIGGPEVEKPVYDTTAITRQVYDPASALYQTNRQTSGMLNRMDVPSINTRTSIANNMLAQRLNQDAQTLSSYQNMNAQGLRDYETRATEQRRYNVGQTLATNQMNAQNRAAYKQAVDNAMTSLGGFGTAMNQKTQAYDTLNILKTIYPDVYRRIIDGMNGIETPVKQTPAAQTTTTTTEAAPQGQKYGGLMKGYYSGGKMKKAKKYGR